MKVEIYGAGASGVMASAAGVMAHFGTTPEAVAMAGAGAIVAVMEMPQPRSRRGMAVLLLFNVIVGAMAAPLLLAQFVPDAGKGALMGATFLIGYVAHDFFGAIRSAVRSRLARKIGGAAE